MFGYAGRILFVNLTNRKTKVEKISEDFCRKFIGGNGFSIHLLYQNTRPKIDPLGPENVLIFAVGPLQGTPIPSSGKYIVQAKSPLTNIMGEAISSGHWGHMLKFAGYDAVVFKGKAEKPTYVFIDDDVVQFIDAKDVWGKDTWQADVMIKEELGDESATIAVIGPAGENLVRFACITNERNRQAGRTGMGAVMGSKNLKALALRGSQNVDVSNLDGLIETCLYMVEQSKGESVRGFREFGTPEAIEPLNEMGANPTRNWQQSKFESIHKVSGDFIKKHYKPRMIACSGCPIACDPISVIKDGFYAGTTASVEHETIYALGYNCGVADYPGIVRASEQCDRLGIDTISTGVTISWAMECYEKGILSKKDTDAIELSFGNHEAMNETIRKIAFRKGKLGNLLAEGSKRASEKVGHNSQHFAMHSKGLELPGFDVRGLKACALGFMVSTRGGCHLRSSPYVLDVSGRIDRFKATSELGKMVMEQETYCTLIDSLILCKIARYLLPSGAAPGYSKQAADEVSSFMANFYSAVTGIQLSAKKMWTAGERIYNLEKAYNVREGWTKKDDYPPPRVTRDKIVDGPAKGSLISREEFDGMLLSYFDAHGWTKSGIPTPEKLSNLDLHHVIRDMEGESNA